MPFPSITPLHWLDQVRLFLRVMSQEVLKQRANGAQHHGCGGCFAPRANSLAYPTFHTLPGRFSLWERHQSPTLLSDGLGGCPTLGWSFSQPVLLDLPGSCVGVCSHSLVIGLELVLGARCTLTPVWGPRGGPRGLCRASRRVDPIIIGDWLAAEAALTSEIRRRDT